jgi:hypothetical protein
MTGKIYHPEDKHPDEWQQDLNPDASKGQNYGLVDPHPEKNKGEHCTAFDVKEVHRQLRGFTDDVLKRIPILPSGSRLQQGAVYIDLADPGRKEIKATGDMEAGPGHWYVPKAEVDYQLWNRLIGVTDPARTGTGHVP